LRAVAAEVEHRDALEKISKTDSGDEEPGGWRP
jgi:hypothetical protein